MNRSARSLAAAFFHSLEAQCALRPEREEFGVDENGRREPVWVTKEREFMLQMVNTERSGLQKKPVEMADIRLAEKAAMHFDDYTCKFSAYCVELVMKDDES